MKWLELDTRLPRIQGVILLHPHFMTLDELSNFSGPQFPLL